MKNKIDIVNGFSDRLRERKISEEKIKILSEFVVPVAMVETGFKSSLYKKSGNALNYGYFPKSPYQNGEKFSTTDDVKFVGGYDNDYKMGQEFADWIIRGERRAIFLNVDTLAGFIKAMKTFSFFSAPVEKYIAAAQSHFKGLNKGNDKGSFLVDLLGKVVKLFGGSIVAAFAALVFSIFLFKQLTKKKYER